MSVCVPRHIICDTFQTGHEPGPGSATLDTVDTAMRARSQQDGSFSPVGGAVWRSTNLGPLDNQIGIRIIWENIIRVNSFKFSSPPAPANANASDSYVEMDVRVELTVKGELISTYTHDRFDNRLTQTAEWEAITTEENSEEPDTTVLCWTCTRNTTNTGDIIDRVRQVFNNDQDNSFATMPTTDKQTVVSTDPNSGDPITWNDGDRSYIGDLNDSEADSAASNNEQYIANDFQLGGATLSEPQDPSGPFFALIHVIDTDLDVDDGSIKEDVNTTFYWGQENQPTCYNLTWIPYETENEEDLDCGMHIVGVDTEQNSFKINGSLDPSLQSGDSITVLGPQINNQSTEAEFGNYRTSLTVSEVKNSQIVVEQSIDHLNSNFQGVTAICRDQTCL